MNNQSPLVPQGSFLEQKQQSRAKVKIAVFVVLAVHGVGLLALLMQGCKKDDTATATAEHTNEVANPAFVASTNVAPPPSNVVAAPTPVPVTPEVTSPAPPSTTAIATDYKIAAGDNFS